MAEGINVDDLRDEIEEQYQSLCRRAQSGGAATLDELADIAGKMSQIMQVIDDLASAIFQLRDKAR